MILERYKNGKIKGIKQKKTIYQILNKVNNKIYIGSSEQFDIRIKTHFSKLRMGKHENKELQKDFNLYGEESFSYSIIEENSTMEKEYQLINDLYKKQEIYNATWIKKEPTKKDKGSMKNGGK